MNRRILTIILAGCTLLMSACGDLTFENKGNVDFDRFRSVFVLPIQINGIYAFSQFDATDDAYDFLVETLQADSGFRKVVTTLGNQTDTDLSVQISIREDYDYDSDLITYYAETKFTLMDSEGTVLHSDQYSDNSEDLSAAVFETLEEVVNFFIQPYRI